MGCPGRTGSGARRKHTPRRGITTVRGAVAAVVTTQAAAADTGSRTTFVIDSTGISVAACHGIVAMSTAGCRQAKVVGTGVVVITIGRRPTQTGAAATFVAGGAGIAVVTIVGVVGGFTSCCRVAGVIGAYVAIVAVE